MAWRQISRNRLSSAFRGGLTVAIFVLAPLLPSCSDDPAGPGRPAGPIVSDEVALYTYRVLNTYPHDPSAFTQGLVWADSVLFESTGLYRKSSLREVELETGRVVRRRNLADQYFAEGLTLWQDVLIQLTWREHKAFVYARDSFDRIDEFDYSTSGWGLTHDGSALIMSDGGDSLYFRDPVSFARQRAISVRDAGGEPVDALNELEYIDDRVFANVWKTELIAVIDPQNGRVTNWIDLSGLLTPEEESRADVLNGIAFDPVARRLFVTGKYWPKLFEIELIPLNE